MERNVRHSLQSLVRETDTVPNNFITETGIRCEIEIKQMYNGIYSCQLWQMRIDKKVHLISICYGKTELEAKEAMKKHILAI